MHGEQHAQQRRQRGVDQADAQALTARAGQDEHQRDAIQHVQEQAGLRRDIGAAGAECIDHVAGHAAGPQQQRQRRGTPAKRGTVAARPPQAGHRRQQRRTGQENEGAHAGRPRPQGHDQAMAQHVQQRQHYRHASPDPQGRMRAR
ncbi:hypothetical protein G6F32_015114 [Rhizopus arrhizus]|nr:hypothetical protein G6F32_015114 [Rhizopus arrhizus]